MFINTVFQSGVGRKRKNVAASYKKTFRTRGHTGLSAPISPASQATRASEFTIKKEHEDALRVHYKDDTAIFWYRHVVVFPC